MDRKIRRFIFINNNNFDNLVKRRLANHLLFLLGKTSKGSRPTAKKISIWLGATQENINQLTVHIKDPHWIIMLLEAFDLYLKQPEAATVYALAISRMLSAARFSDTFRSVASNAMIRSLTISSRESLTLLNVNLLAEVVANNHSLETLSLTMKFSQTQLEDSHMDEKRALLPLFRAIAALPCLERLSLGLLEMPSDVVAMVSRILASSGTIRDVWLCVRNFTASDSQALANAVIANDTLDQLVLSEYVNSDTVDDTVFRPLCRALHRPIRLRCLALNCRSQWSVAARDLENANTTYASSQPAGYVKPMLGFSYPRVDFSADPDHFCTFSLFTDIETYGITINGERVVVRCRGGTDMKSLRDRLTCNPHSSIRLELLMPSETDIVTLRDKQDIKTLSRITSLTIISPTFNALDSLFKARPMTRKRVKQEKSN
jgi:hypothetical protein